MPVCKLFQFSNHLIITGITVVITHHLPELLEGIHDNQFGVSVFPDNFFKLFIQTAADHLSTGSNAKGVFPLHTEHAEHPVLQMAFAIFQCKIEDCSVAVTYIFFVFFILLIPFLCYFSGTLLCSFIRIL